MRDREQVGGSPESISRKTATSRKFKAAQEIAQMGYWEYHFNNQVYWSEEVYRICGKDPNVYVPDRNSIKEGVHPEDQEGFDQLHQEIVNKGGDFELEYRKVMPSGDIKWLRERGRLIKDEDGNPLRVEGTIQDITLRKKEQEELHLQRERERGILDSHTNYIIRTDFQGNYTYANQKYRQEFGWVFNQEDIIGKSAFATVMPYHQQRLVELTQQVAGTDRVIEMQLDKRAKTGQIKNTHWEIISIADTKGQPIEVQCVGVDITDRLATEALLRESNARYEMVRKAISDIIWDEDLISGKKFWGEGFLTHFGHDQNARQSPFFWERHLHPGDSEKVISRLNQALEGSENTWADEYRFKRADGTYAFVVDRAFIERDSKGRPIRIVGSMQDMSEQKRLEKVLSKATNLSRIGSFEYDRKTEQLFWSNMTYQIHEVPTSYTPTLLKWQEFFEDQDQVVMEIIVREAIQTGTAFDQELLLTTPKGNRKWVRVMADPEMEDGQCVQLNGSVQDIDKLKRAELEARKAYQEKDVILESIEDGFFALNESHQATYWNKRATLLTGFPKEAILGKSVLEVFPEQARQQFVPQYLKSINRKKPRQFEVYQESSSTWFDVTVYPQQSGSSVFFRDITQRKLAELQLLQLNESLQQHTTELVRANKDLEQFSFIVSHNLRAPVANILGLADLINDEQHSEEVKKELFRELSENAQRMDGVIKDLNTILRVKNERSEHKEVVRLQEVTDAITSSIGHLMHKEKAVVETDFNSVPALHTVRSYIHSIFYNFISNSIKYRHPERNPHIQIKALQEDGKVQLRFKDNGLGFDLEKKKDQLFGLYKRFHTHVEGKGMGLFMVKTQVEMLGGKISASSQVDKGTEFCIEFDKDILGGLD